MPSRISDSFRVASGASTCNMPAMTIDPATARTAVLSHDRAFDDVFVYGVVTTSIYCLPSCPSRPKADNLLFFADSGLAEAQGFRACRRCRPDG